MYEHIKKEGIALNNAFVEAFVSYFAYDNRRWIIEDNKPNVSNPVLEAIKKSRLTPNDLSAKKAFEMYASIFSKNKFQPVDLQLPKKQLYKSKNFGFETECHSSIGDYQALNNLARACIVRSKNTDSSYTLHVSYRGTDTDARTFSKFVTDAYLDMSAYYDAFKPLEKAILEYVEKAENNITKINVSGHSLGGAMVSEFFNSPEVKSCTIPMQGITYGAPGNHKKALYNIFPTIYHSLKTRKFLALGKAVMDIILLPKKESIHECITQYSHVGDLIPRVASLLYDRAGTQVKLKDYASQNTKESFILTGKLPVSFLQQKRPTDVVKKIMSGKIKYIQPNFFNKTKDFMHKVVTFQYHDMLRYMINIERTSQMLVLSVNKQENLEMKKALNSSLTDILEFSKYKKHYDKIYNPHPTANMMKKMITAKLIEKAKNSPLYQGQLPEKLNLNIVERIKSLRIKVIVDDFNSLKVTPI